MINREDVGFTLTELIVVIIIIGILVTLALPQFSRTKESALGKEARANLKLIAAAEKIYRMEIGGYYPIPAASQSVISEINDHLKLSATEANWDYSVTSTGTPPSTFTVYGDRLGSGGYLDCQYSINQAQDEPVIAAGTCP